MDLAEIDRLLEANPELRTEINSALARGLRPLEAPPRMRLSTWMVEHFYLSEESSYEKGRWTFYPYQVAIADCIGDDDIPFIDWMKSARTGYTKIFLAAICYFAEHKRRNQIVYQPTDGDRDDFTTDELDPALRDVKVMKRVFPKFNRKSKENTMKKKRFLGCLLHLRGATASKNFRRLTADNVYYDECDGMARDVEKEGSPFKLGDKRVEGATFPKSVAGSTPKIKGFSLIEARVGQADWRVKYHIRCPGCGDEHSLEWGGKDVAHGFKWRNDDPSTASHVCPHCGVWITQSEYLENWRGRWKTDDGRWIDESDPEQLRFRDADGTELPRPHHIAFFTWTIYSPQANWSSMVKDWIEASRNARAGDDSDLKTFINTTRGETYEVELEKTEASALEKRGKEGHAACRPPRGCVKLVMGVDVQGDRWEVVTWGFGRGEEMWVIDYVVIYGNPADQREWDTKLDPHLQTVYTHECGAEMRSEAAAIDTGGHYTHQAYVFVRNRPKQNLYAVKGETKEGRPIKSASSLVDVNERGRLVKKGVRLWFVGTDTAKDLLHGRLQVPHAGPGFVHFCRDLPADFYNGLTAESRMLVKTARGEVYRWLKPPGKRNEPLDCTVYALFLAQALGLHQLSDRMWQRLEAAFEPDLFAGKEPAAASPLAAPVQTPAQPQPQVRPNPSPAPAPRSIAREASSIANEDWSNRL